MASIQVGTPAPDFTLPDTGGQAMHLADLRGQAVALVFFPFAFSGICTGEACEIRDNLSAFEEHGVKVFGISCDPSFSQKAWADSEGYQFDFLSDFWPHGEVAKAYGVFVEDGGMAKRGSFLIDPDGIVRWSVVNEPGAARDFEGYREALAAL